MQKEPPPTGSGSCVLGREVLAGDLAGLEAAGADVQALGRAVDRRAHALDVGVEATLRNLARPGAVVTEARALGADVTDGSHRELLGLLGTDSGSLSEGSGQPHKSIRRPPPDANRAVPRRRRTGRTGRSTGPGLVRLNRRSRALP